MEMEMNMPDVVEQTAFHNRCIEKDALPCVPSRGSWKRKGQINISLVIRSFNVETENHLVRDNHLFCWLVMNFFSQKLQG